MSKEIITTFRPNRKQAMFLTSTAKYTGFGGARGGGKSWAVRLGAAMKCQQYAGYKALIVRLSYPELEGNHIIPLQQMLAGIAKYNKSEKRFTFPNGSSIKLDHCQDVTHYQGQEYDGIWLDECTNIKQ